jgi:RNA-dependent RNA polymerase
MELNITCVPFKANEWAVTRAIAKVLHSDDFGAVVPGRLINFRVRLKEGDAGGIRNDGTGTLTLPFEKTGFKFLDRVKIEPIKIDKMKLRFYPSGKPSDWMVQTLSKTPYVDPDIEEAHQAKLIILEEDIRVDKVQFGILYRDKYPSNSRSFSIEWERKYIESYATLSFEYNYKRLLLQVKAQFCHHSCH